MYRLKTYIFPKKLPEHAYAVRNSLFLFSYLFYSSCFPELPCYACFINNTIIQYWYKIFVA